ncbi:MAG: DUF6067 family protein [Verrucomicrobiota bacterium]
MNSFRSLRHAPGLRLLNLVACLAWWTLCGLGRGGAAETLSLKSLLGEMTNREAVARLPRPPYQCLQASSYNRASTNRNQPNQDASGWFGDSDGLGFIRTEQINGQTEWVIMEHSGPGCLTKLWTPFFYYGFDDKKGPNVRIYLDGQTSPVLDESLIALVTGRGSFKPPFSAQTARAGDCYFPIPFARSCKITVAAKPFYYLINYRAYPEGTAVQTFTGAGYHSAALEIENAGNALLAASQVAPLPDSEASIVKPGAKLEVTLPSGPGAIRKLAVRAPGATTYPALLRSTILTMTFDGEETVWCPLGDFFCSADSLHPIETWERSVRADGTFVCRWAMPYQKSAVVRILNLGTQPVDLRIDTEAAGWEWDDRSLHFHAHWRPDDVVAGMPFRDWNFVDIRGQGIFVGDAWTVLNPQGSWWGEGDEKIYVDGEWAKGFPSHFGTGSEDYYGWAGGEIPTRQDEFTMPFLANARVGGLDGHTAGFNICTRTRSLDAIPFRQRLVFDMESSFGTDIRNPWNLLGYSAVTFWYARPGASHNRPYAPGEAARPILSLVDLKAKADLTKQLIDRHRDEVALVFARAREFPIRPAQGLAAALPSPPSRADQEFTGLAHPGEFFVFQLGVYALKEAGPLSLVFEDLAGPSGNIPAGNLRCLNLGGTNYLGQPFTKTLWLHPDQLQVLWIGVEVPNAAHGLYSGVAQVQIAPGRSLPVHLTLRVEGVQVEDHGDAVAQNLSRLRWLDSTVGSEATVTSPFREVRAKGRVIQLLGRELELGESGLPARLSSFFSPANTHLVSTARDVLAQPMRFMAETRSGPVRWESHFDSIARTDLEARWTAHSTADGLRADVSGRLDHTGCGEVHVQLRAEQDLQLIDARLEVPFREDVARYFMGLHQRGARRPPEVNWKWDVTRRQDCFWLGDVNAGLMLRFKDAEYLRPPVNIYYSFRPLRLPTSWGNDGRGGVNVGAASTKACWLAPTVVRAF